MEAKGKEMRVIAAITLCFFLAACPGREPKPATKKPCGVITDSLVDVQGKRTRDQQRIDKHYARGEGAGCWK